MKKTASILVAMVIMLSLTLAAPTVQAATPQEIADAIEDGIAWLVSVQNDDGSWGPQEGTQEKDRFGTTGLILVKLQDRAFELGFDGPFDDNYPFKEDVVDGLNFLLPYAINVTITPQIAGNPDTDGDGQGVYVDYEGNTRDITYNTGILMMAIAAGRDSEQVVEGGPLAGWTYGDVLQDLVDWMAYAQTDTSIPTLRGRGGWYYWAVNGGYKADNSVAGYAILGLLYAQAPLYGYRSNIPAFVATELNHWIDYIQNDVDGDGYDGGSGYEKPTQYVNSLKTGNLLTQMAFVGDAPSDTRVVDALDYIGRHWDSDWVQGWGKDGDVHYQATYCLMKGLKTMDIPLSGVPGVVDWYDDMATKILTEQNDDDHWPSNPYCILAATNLCGYCSAELSTAWVLLTLERDAPPPLNKLDHFTGYPIPSTAWSTTLLSEDVHLEDQFGAVDATVGSATFFFNPVEKVHGNATTQISNPDNHLTFYSIYGQEEQTCSVKVVNQFGAQNLSISGPVGLVVPTQKVEPGDHEPPVGLDHFLYYAVSGGPDVDVVVGLNDQFGNTTVMVTTPVGFATPVQKTHGENVTEIKNPEAHLVFYEIGSGVLEREVQVINQFGNPTFNIFGPTLLAVPSETLPYTLTISSTGQGYVQFPGEGTFTYDAGTKVDLQAVVTMDGCSFAGWFGDVDTIAAVTSTETTITMCGDYSITANFDCYGSCGGFISISVRDTPIAKEVQTLLGLLLLVSVPGALWVRRRWGSRNGCRST